MQFGDNGQYGNGCTSVCGLQVQWMYAFQDQITGVREIKGNPVRASHTLLFIVLLVFSLCANGWSRCTYFSSGTAVSNGNGFYCYYGACDLSSGSVGGATQSCMQSVGCSCPGTIFKYQGAPYYFSGLIQNNFCTTSGTCNVVSAQNSSNCFYHYRCDTQAEADSVKCINNPSAPGCSSPCSAYQKQCESAKGKFSGTVGPDGKCSAVCDLCDKESVKAVEEKYRQTCCDQLKAPPETKICTTPVQSGPGMSESVYNNGDYKCQDPNLDSLTSERYYQMCYDYDPDAESSDDGGNSSSGDGSSSSGDGGSSGSQYPEGCDECPWLDSILDTLTLQKGKVDAIYDCLTLPGLCSGMENERDTTIINIDSALLKYITPYLDSTIRLDSSQLRALQKLDTNLLKAIKNDSAALDNDTMIYRAIGDAGHTNDTNLIKLRAGVYNMDTVMKHRLDSLIKRIPSDVFDSIIKYQDSTMDRIDSALWGKGVGFSLVDSLVDSTVKYFKESNHYDSVYNKMFHDFDSTLMGKLDNMEVTGELGLDGFGYGDTASKSLRDDIEGLRDGVDSVLALLGDTSFGGNGGGSSVDGWGDSVAKYMYTGDDYDRDFDSLETAWGVKGLDSAWDSSYSYGLCRGDDCPPCTDDSCMGRITGNLVFYGDSVASEMGARLQASVDSQRSQLPTFWDSTFAELKQYSWFGSFDSTFLANIGAKIPNTNTCPDHCFRQDVNGVFANVPYNLSLDWKLCVPVAPSVLNGLNAFDLIKLFARIITVVTCLSILMWEVSSRRGGGIGL